MLYWVDFLERQRQLSLRCAVLKCLSDSSLFHTAHLMGACFVYVVPLSLCQNFTALSHCSYKQLFWWRFRSYDVEYEMTCTTGTLNDCCRHGAAVGLHTCVIPRWRNFRFTIWNNTALHCSARINRVFIAAMLCNLCEKGYCVHLRSILFIETFHKRWYTWANEMVEICN